VLAEAAADLLPTAVLGYHIARVGYMGSERQGVGPDVTGTEWGSRLWEEILGA
jgi:hypothetical protein